MAWAHCVTRFMAHNDILSHRPSAVFPKLWVLAVPCQLGGVNQPKTRHESHVTVHSEGNSAELRSCVFWIRHWGVQLSSVGRGQRCLSLKEGTAELGVPTKPLLVSPQSLECVAKSQPLIWCRSALHPRNQCCHWDLHPGSVWSYVHILSCN